MAQLFLFTLQTALSVFLKDLITVDIGTSFSSGVGEWKRSPILTTLVDCESLTDQIAFLSLLLGQACVVV